MDAKRVLRWLLLVLVELEVVFVDGGGNRKCLGDNRRTGRSFNSSRNGVTIRHSWWEGWIWESKQIGAASSVIPYCIPLELHR